MVYNAVTPRVRSFAASLSVTMREKLVMILIALGQAHGSQFAPLVVRAARGSVMCVGRRCGGERCGEGAAHEVSTARGIDCGASGVGERFRERPRSDGSESSGTSICARSPRDLVAERSRLS